MPRLLCPVLCELFTPMSSIFMLPCLGCRMPVTQGEKCLKSKRNIGGKTWLPHRKWLVFCVYVRAHTHTNESRNLSFHSSRREHWTARRSNQSILREINPEYSLEELMLKLKLQYFDDLMRTDDSLEKSSMLGKIEGRRRRLHQSVQLFATPWAGAHQFFCLSLSPLSLNFLKFMPIESMMLSNHLILCHPLLLLPSVFPESESFSVSQLFASGGQSIGVPLQHQCFQWIFKTDFL